MRLIIRKEVLHQLLFIACVAVPYLNIYEATFGIWSLTLLLTIKRKYSLDILRLAACFVAILIMAVIPAFFHDVTTYNFIRDFTYLLKPIIGLFVGYQLCKDYIKNPLMMLVKAGMLIAIIHLLAVLYTVLTRPIPSMHKLREFTGYFSDFEVYAFIVVLFARQLGLQISKTRATIALAILLVSISLYMARTNFIQLGILFFALKGYLVINKRSVIIITLTVLLLGAGYAAIYKYNPSAKAKGFEAFLYKIKNAPIEPFKTKVSKDNWVDFNNNYRSYENILTLRQMKQEEWPTLVFGKGMGSSVDLKRKVWLQTSVMRYIPFLHNGFMTILLKAGIIGNIILIYSIILLFRYGISGHQRIQAFNYLLLGTGVYLIISYRVFMGLYFTVDTKSIVIGFIIKHRENLLKRVKTGEI